MDQPINYAMRSSGTHLMWEQRFDKDFTYHAPKDESQIERYGRIRDMAKGMAWALAEMCPQSREQSVALTHLEEMVFWANASIARNE